MELTILWAFVKNTIFLSTLINRHEKLVFSLFQQEKLGVLSVLSIVRPFADFVKAEFADIKE